MFFFNRIIGFVSLCFIFDYFFYFVFDYIGSLYSCLEGRGENVRLF